MKKYFLLIALTANNPCIATDTSTTTTYDCPTNVDIIVTGNALTSSGLSWTTTQDGWKGTLTKVEVYGSKFNCTYVYDSDQLVSLTYEASVPSGQTCSASGSGFTCSPSS